MRTTTTTSPARTFAATVLLSLAVVAPLHAAGALAAPLPASPKLPPAKLPTSPLPGSARPAPAFETRALVPAHELSLRGAVQEITASKATVRVSLKGAPLTIRRGMRARIARFDGGRRSETWLATIVRGGKTPLIELPSPLEAAFSELGGTYQLAIVDVDAAKVLSNEVPVLSAKPSTPTLTRATADLTGLWAYLDQTRAATANFAIPVELDGIQLAPSDTRVLQWVLSSPSPTSVWVDGKPASVREHRVRLTGADAQFLHRFDAGSASFQVLIPTAWLPGPEKLGSPIPDAKVRSFLDHLKLTITVVDPRTGQQLGTPLLVTSWPRPSKREPDRDFDGDGADDWSFGGADCDDGNPNVSSDITEVCDAEDLDEDCNPATIGDRDADGDGFIAWECCNGSLCGTDCDDRLPYIHPHQIEACNGRDDNCNGSVDEELLNCPTNGG
jgi:hypothetical protein